MRKPDAYREIVDAPDQRSSTFEAPGPDRARHRADVGSEQWGRTRLCASRPPCGPIWPLPEGLDDESLELLLFPAGESLLSGAQVTEVARKHGATRWQIYDWRRRFRHPLASTRCGLRQRQHVHERGRRAAVRQPKLGGTRSRAYKKNGQAFVEQKNGAVVRRLMGCGRSMASTRRT